VVPGSIVCNGEVIGQHDGAIFYTIGQRHGLGIGGGKPFYVTGKDMKTNTVYVTDDPDDSSLERREFGLEQMHWIDERPEAGKSYTIRIRHRGSLTGGKLDGNKVVLDNPERAVAVGQSAVVYDGEVVLGGGMIA
jgi:tRNA-specific 2-thiouridylase